MSISSERPRIRWGLASIYEAKPSRYFANARDDIVALLQTGPTDAILELGCGEGGTGKAVLEAGKAGSYLGIELNLAAASVAKRTLSDVLVGNAEEMDLTALSGRFDALIISEVLEHLTDPWRTLQRLADCIKPGGAVFASSPNVAHWRVVRGLIMGRFQYTESGVMDQTHLRWFTPESYRALFDEAGIEVQDLRPLVPLGWRPTLFNAATGGRFKHLFVTQMMLIGTRR